MTERLYDRDSHIRDFSACVRSCVQTDGGWETVLDETAFFPGGGGQAPDTGTIEGLPVLSVYESGDDVVHVLPEEVSGQVHGRIDWDARFRRMQAHSGEHVVSGIVHRLYGYENVGFHMGADGIVVDFSGWIDPAGLDEVERLANETVTGNLSVSVDYPAPDALAGMDYRSKKELTGRVRIVSIGGVDRCACCAPHVRRTGEIGLIKILDSIRHREGVRITMLCGQDAFADYKMKAGQVAGAAALLSAKPENVAEAVGKARAEIERLTHQVITLKRRIAEYAASTLLHKDGNLCVFVPDFDADQLRVVANRGMELCTGVCAVFSGTDGAYAYIIGSRTADLRKNARSINAAISGRGGGRPEMIQGSAAAARTDIERYFDTAVF